MHEFALAEAVIAAALEEAEREGLSRITRVTVRIGELQRIEREVFRFALQEVLPATEPRIAATHFSLETEPARFRCRPCAYGFGLADTRQPPAQEASQAIHFIPELAHSFLCCPRCDSPDFELIEGRGVSIESIEGS